MDKNQMDKKKREVTKPAQSTVIIRLLAGGYLVYLAHDLFKIYLNPAEGGKLYQLGCAAFFFAVGAALAVWSVRKYVKGEYVKNGVHAGTSETETTLEAAPETASETAPEAASETVSEAALEVAPETAPEAAPENSASEETKKIISNQEDD